MAPNGDDGKAGFGPPFPLRAAGLLVFAAAMLAGLAMPSFRDALLPRPLATLMLLASLALPAAWLLARLLRWRMATALAVAWVLPLAWFAGPLAVVAVLLMLLAATAVAARFAGAPGRDPAVLAVAGLLALAGLAGWVLGLPVHHRWTWLLALAAACLAFRAPLGAALGGLRRAWGGAVAGAPFAAAAAVLMLGLASTAAWLPDLQADDLAFHLRLPAQLLQDGSYLPDPAHMIWAYAPWSGDVLHAIAGLLAGRESHGALGAAWLALCAVLAWRLSASLGGSPRMRWLCAWLVCSVPLLGGLATGMHTELPATAALLALMALPGQPGPGRLRLAAVLAGGLAGLKLMHIFAALPLLGWLAWRDRGQLSIGRSLRLLLLFAAVGLSSYVLGWIATGNPVLPLFNDLFRSGFAPLSNFDDPRWRAGLSPDLPWRLSFETTRFLEYGRGALGFGLVGLAGAMVAAFSRRRLATPMLMALLAMLLPLLVIQYARYALPGLACVMVVAATAAETFAGLRVATLLVVLVAGANALALPSGNWLLGTKALRRHVQHGGDAALLESRFLPAAWVLHSVPEGNRSRVLATDPRMPYAAPFGRRGRAVNWYAPRLQARAIAADRDASGRAWLALLREVDPEWLLVDEANAGKGLEAALQAYGAAPVARCGPAGLWQRPPPGAQRIPSTHCP